MRAKISWTEEKFVGNYGKSIPSESPESRELIRLFQGINWRIDRRGDILPSLRVFFHRKRRQAVVRGFCAERFLFVIGAEKGCELRRERW